MRALIVSWFLRRLARRDALVRLGRDGDVRWWKYDQDA